jgi:hypothetical protein
MIDFRQLFAELVQVVRSADFPDADTIMQCLNLDTSTARISKTKKGVLTINDTHLRKGDLDVYVIGSLSPLRALNLLFTKSQITYRSIDGEVFGADQRIERSKRSEGFAILFQDDELCCGLTVSGPDGVIESVFCEAPRSAPVA